MPIYRDEYEKVPYFERGFWSSPDGETYYHVSETDQKTVQSEDQTLTEKLKALFQNQEENHDESE